MDSPHPTASSGHRPGPRDRRSRGDYPTPIELVECVVDAVLPAVRPGQRVTVLDPACGDGRFLRVAAERVTAAGGRPVLHGVDLDSGSVATARANLASLDASIDVGDALARSWGGAVFDVVVGNPPFLSQLSAATARGGASRHGGGPYADAAAEFLALAVDLARPGGGRVGLVLPQSILGSRDAGPVRAAVTAKADLTWSWWSPRRHFDAAVLVCALGFERRAGNSTARAGDRHHVWTDVILRAIGVPEVPAISAGGTVGDRCRLTANFRDQYYGLVPAVADDADGPRFVTSALIDPNHCAWGEREIVFHRRRYLRPRVDLGRLDGRMRRWAGGLAVPKVLVANQTRVVECVVDRDGSLLPGVPVITARPTFGDLDEIAAVLSAPLASAWLWHATAGTGLSARTIRLRPDLLAAVPWPAGPLDDVGGVWRSGDLAGAASVVHAAYGLGAATKAELTSWWRDWISSPRSRSGVAA